MKIEIEIYYHLSSVKWGFIIKIEGRIWNTQQRFETKKESLDFALGLLCNLSDHYSI